MIILKSAILILIILVALSQLYGNAVYSKENDHPPAQEDEKSKGSNLFDPSCFSSSFNDGEYQYIPNGVRIFAKEARDPGVYLETAITKISDFKYFVFDIKGKLERLGQWCFPVVQIYDIQDDDYTPSITKTSFTFKDDEPTTIIVPLEGKIRTISKIQFMLVTDRGSWDVNITNAHFE